MSDIKLGLGPFTKETCTKCEALEQKLAVAVTKLKAISDSAYEKQHQCDCEVIAQEALALIKPDTKKGDTNG